MYTRTVKDQMGREITVPLRPERIISLVPSQTQLLHTFGLENEVVGITKFCIHPDEWFQNKTRIGGTKTIKIDLVKELQPDLIIGNKEENSKEDILELEKIAPVWMSDIYSLDDAFNMIHEIGGLTNSAFIAEELIVDIQSNFSRLNELVSKGKFEEKKVLYFIWHKPDMLAGKNTFVDNMLSHCGFINVAGNDRYPEYNNTIHEVDFVLLSSEPFPFNEKHMNYFKDKFPKSEIIIVNGEMFSWYGSMLREAPSYFLKLIREMVNN